MRYYDVKITNATTGQLIVPASLTPNGPKPTSTFTSLLPDGSPNSAALNVEFDLPMAMFDQPAGNAWLRVWGLSIADLGAAFDLNGAGIEIRAGMTKGLPLATAAYDSGQAGLILKASIFQAFGNWIGTAQTLDLYLIPPTGTAAAPGNYVLDWTAGTTLAAALKNTLDVARPGIPQTIAISPNLVQGFDDQHFCPTLENLAALVMNRSKAVITDPTYRGVSIADNGARIVVSDQTTVPAAKQISFQDLIGQPTWIAPSVIQVKTVLRADVFLADLVTIPPNIPVTAFENSLLRLQDKTSFTGNFFVTSIHHYGNFRQADAASWNTTIDMTPEIK